MGIMLVMSFNSYADVYVGDLKTTPIQAERGYNVSYLYQDYRSLFKAAPNVPFGKLDAFGVCVGNTTFLRFFAARNNMTCTDGAFRNLGYGSDHVWLVPIVTQSDLDAGISLESVADPTVAMEATVAIEQSLMEKRLAEVKRTATMKSALAIERLRGEVNSVKATADAKVARFKEAYASNLVRQRNTIWIADIIAAISILALAVVWHFKNKATSRVAKLRHEVSVLKEEALRFAKIPEKTTVENEQRELFFLKYGIMLKLQDDMETQYGESSIYLLRNPSNREYIHVPGHEDSIKEVNFLERLRSKENLRKLVGVRFKEARSSKLQAVSA
mgnify:CR=1 FL=1